MGLAVLGSGRGGGEDGRIDPPTLERGNGSLIHDRTIRSENVQPISGHEPTRATAVVTGLNSDGRRPLGIHNPPHEMRVAIASTYVESTVNHLRLSVECFFPVPIRGGVWKDRRAFFRSLARKPDRIRPDRIRTPKLRRSKPVSVITSRSSPLSVWPKPRRRRCKMARHPGAAT